RIWFFFMRNPKVDPGDNHQNTKYQIEYTTPKIRRGNGAQNGAGDRGDRENSARLVIDAFHASVCRGARQRIEEHYGEGNGGDQFSFFLRIDQQQHWNENKAAARAY